MPTTDTEERRIADRYLLKRQIGAGGMGVVWEALDELLARRVAIKEIELPAVMVGMERAKFAARVLREARAAARLTHPGAVTLYDVIREQGTTYIVMELVEAPPLSALVQEEGPLPPEQAARIGLQVLAALEVAHGRGIVHRDVKPGNVLVLPDGQTKLTDFGIATLRGDPELTATGVVLGSPGYMAPEQASGEGSGPATDLYGLGAALYYAVEGQAPFEKGAPIPTITAVVTEEPRPMRRAGPLGPVIERLMTKDPAGRPTSVEVRRLLARVASPSGGPVATGPLTTRALAGLGPATLQGPAAVEVPAQPPAAPAGAGTSRPAATEAPPGTAEDERTLRQPPRAAPRAAPAAVVGRAGGRRPGTLPVIGAVLLAGAVVAAALVATRAGGDGADRSGSAAPTTASGAGRGDAPSGDAPPGGAASSTTGQPAPTTAEPSQGGGAPAVPAGWRTFRGQNGVYRLAYPQDWSVRKGRGRIVDFVRPGSGTYLRVDWTDRPQDPVRNWIEYERQFAASHAGYQKLRLEPATFQGMRAADWEYRYRSGGQLVHAVNITFVTDSGRFAYAFNFQTREEDWAASTDLRQELQRQFRAAG